MMKTLVLPADGPPISSVHFLITRNRFLLQVQHPHSRLSPDYHVRPLPGYFDDLELVPHENYWPYTQRARDLARALPPEVYYVILEHLFVQYLAMQSFECAALLATAVSPYLTLRLHSIWIGVSVFWPVDVEEAALQLSRTCRFALQLVDDYLAQPLGDHPPQLATETDEDDDDDPTSLHSTDIIDDLGESVKILQLTHPNWTGFSHAPPYACSLAGIRSANIFGAPYRMNRSVVLAGRGCFNGDLALVDEDWGGFRDHPFCTRIFRLIHPVVILEFDDSWAASLRDQFDEEHAAEIDEHRSLVSDGLEDDPTQVDVYRQAWIRFTALFQLSMGPDFAFYRYHDRDIFRHVYKPDVV